MSVGVDRNGTGVELWCRRAQAYPYRLYDNAVLFKFLLDTEERNEGF
jgi:hypothetical protein